MCEYHYKNARKTACFPQSLLAKFLQVSEEYHLLGVSKYIPIGDNYPQWDKMSEMGFGTTIPFHLIRQEH